MCTLQPPDPPDAIPQTLKKEHCCTSMARTAVGDSSRGPRDTKVANIIRSDRAPPRRTANSSNNPSSTAGALLALLILSVWTNPSPTTVHAFAGLSTRTPSGARLAGYRCAKALDPTRDREHRSTFSSRRPLGSSSGSSSVGGSSRRARPARAATTTTASSDADGVRTASSDELVDAAAGATSSAQGEQGTTKKQKKKKKERLRVTTAAEMRRLVSEGGGMKLFDLDARGDSQDMLEAREDEHPVLEVLRERVEAGTKPGSHGDGLKVGLAIEGGGMRGCVSAGMIATILTLGLMDTFDSVYGSSAGSLVGAYAIARQEGMPRLGCSVYYDTLTGTGKHFIDTRQIFRAMGLGLFGTVVTRWRGVKELVRQNFGSPVLNLDYLLHDVVEQHRPLDWEGFWEKQASQPLHVIASGVSSKKAVVMTSKNGNFNTLRELTECMRGSMLLPGITGPMVTPPNVNERLVDSQLYEQIPFQTALDDGCTHVLVLRSRPDGGNLLGKPKLVERLVARRFFKRKSKDRESYAFVKSGGPKKLYAESVLTLNEAAKAKIGDAGPFVMPLCLPAPEPEVGRLERDRGTILEGVRKGYEHAHLVLRRAAPEHLTAELDGRQAALQAFPDSILSEATDPVVREILERSSASATANKDETQDQ